MHNAHTKHENKHKKAHTQTWVRKLPPPPTPPAAWLLTESPLPAAASALHANMDIYLNLQQLYTQYLLPSAGAGAAAAVLRENMVHTFL